MRPALFRTLLGVSVLSLFVLLVPRRPPADVGSQQEERLQPDSNAAAAVPVGSALPVEIDVARGNPFAIAPLTVVAKAPPIPEPPQPAQPVPAPPRLEHRFFGRLTTPVGQQVILLTRGEKTVVASVGQVLDDGYVVDAVLPQAVRLRYPALGTLVELPVPRPPSERR